MTSNDDGTGLDWKAWRREQRKRLIAARRNMAADERRVRNAAIDAALAAGFAALGGRCIGFCWPFAGEPEPRFAVRRWREQGSRAALPVVVAPRRPLEFREWWPGVNMAKGVYDIPCPVDSDRLVPGVALVPVVGFDDAGYRLGYGGGYFDRTLAAMAARPLCIGLGYESQHLDTIHPQPHDIPFDFMVTEAGIRERRDGRLVRLDVAAVDRAVGRRLASA